MTIPFLSYFKKSKGDVAVKEKPAAAPKPTLPPIEKPSSERFSKTVMPNATRTLPPQDPFEMAARSTAMGGQAPGPSVPLPNSPRTISFSPLSPSGGLPPAVALALEPKVERVISLELADVVAAMPTGHVKALSDEDGQRRILVRASEVEKGMASGKPSVSIATIYDQVPEIFLKTIEESDASWQVQLPFAKVLEQFANMHVRADQERHLVVPQVETPFLKVAVEDSSEFGTTMEPLELNPGELPSVRVELPTAEAFAAAEPEGVADIQARMPSARSNGKTPPAPTAQAPTRIPFKLSPNGTDVPAPESVPASSGPSVPNLPAPLAPPDARINDPHHESGSSQNGAPAAPAPATPVRIPFKFTPKTDDEAKPKPEPWLTKESMAAAADMADSAAAAPEPVAETSKPTEPKIALPLLPILKSLPPMQLTGDPSCVPADVRIELPFSLIEPQLASGRISVTTKVFEAGLPVSFRGLFQAGPGAIDVSLPLQEVLKNLPAASLRMRDDQEEQEAGQNFATPFSAKAEEDAKRFNVPTTPVAKPVVAAEPAPVVAGVSPAISEKAADTAAATGKAADTAAATGKAADTAAATGKAADTAASTKKEAAPAATTEETEAGVTEADEGNIVAKGDKAPRRSLRTPLQVALETDEKLDAKGVVALINKMPGVKSSALLFGDGLSLAGSLPPELETDGLCAMAPSLMQRVENHMVDTKLGQLRGMTLSCTKGSITFYMHENLCLAALHADLDLPSETREKLSRVTHEMSRKYSHPI